VQYTQVLACRSAFAARSSASSGTLKVRICSSNLCSGVEDWIWNADSRLYIDSAEVQFNRTSVAPDPVVAELRALRTLSWRRLLPGVTIIAAGVLIALWIAKLWR
jgi:hypothetical protein